MKEMYEFYCKNDRKFTAADVFIARINATKNVAEALEILTSPSPQGYGCYDFIRMAKNTIRCFNLEKIKCPESYKFDFRHGMCDSEHNHKIMAVLEKDGNEVCRRKAGSESSGNDGRCKHLNSKFFLQD